jgi:regulator of protease activity HflC (stomatin/prohibitin superfamily)
MAITKDNVSLEIDGVLFIKIEDAYKASYSIEDPHEAVKLLTLTLLRSEIGKIELDNLF